MQLHDSVLGETKFHCSSRLTFFVCELLSHLCEFSLQLRSWDVASLLFVKHPQRCQNFRFGLLLLNLPVHHREERGEVQLTCLF